MYIAVYNTYVWIPCPRTNTPRENVETPSVLQTFFLETRLGELGRLSHLEPRHGLFSFHIPLTDPPRRIYRQADSRSGTLESPAGRFFDPSVVGSITTARPPLSLLLCPSSFCLCPDYCLSPRCLHSTAVVHSLEHFAHAERSGLITHQRFRLGSLIGVHYYS